MTDSSSSTVHVPLVLVQDDLVLSDEKRAKMVFILDASLPGDLKEAVESLIETGLSQVELMGEILTVMAELLSEKRRPLRRSCTGSSTVSRDRLQRGSLHNTLHHDRSEGGYEHSTMRKWRNTIEQRLEAQQL